MTLAEAHILLVDDEPVLRMTLGMLLRRQGAFVTEAANGAEALVILRRSVVDTPAGPDASAEAHPPIDLMLTDRHMPVMDGPALLRAAAEAGVAVPTVLCAGTFGDEDEPDLSSYGVHATLLKPFPPAELITTLEGVLGPLPMHDARAAE